MMLTNFLTALYVSYLIPIILLFMKRCRKEPITFGPWHLGRFGFLINLYAIVFGVFVSIWLPFPGSVPVTAAYFNYSGPVFGFLLLLALGDWFFRGRHYYEVSYISCIVDCVIAGRCVILCCEGKPMLILHDRAQQKKKLSKLTTRRRYWIRCIPHRNMRRLVRRDLFEAMCRGLG